MVRAKPMILSKIKLQPPTLSGSSSEMSLAGTAMSQTCRTLGPKRVLHRSLKNSRCRRDTLLAPEHLALPSPHAGDSSQQSESGERTVYKYPGFTCCGKTMVSRVRLRSTLTAAACRQERLSQPVVRFEGTLILQLRQSRRDGTICSPARQCRVG
jgi:hypothetical protein